MLYSTLHYRAWRFDPIGGREDEFWRGPLSELPHLPRPPDGTIWAIEPIVGTFADSDWAELIELVEELAIPGLSFHERRIKGSVLKFLARAPGLRFLSLRATPIKDADLPALRDLAGLEHVILHNQSKKITDAGLGALPLEHLRTLHVHEGKLSDRVGETLAGMAMLESLALPSIFTTIKGQGLDSLAQLRSLRYLDLSLWRLKDRDISFISDLGSLRGLTLRRREITAEKLTFEGLRQIGHLTHLERIELVGHPVGDELLHELARLPKLRIVKIWQPALPAERTASLTLEGVTALANSEHLEHVELGPLHNAFTPEEAQQYAQFRQVLSDRGVG